MLVCMTSAIAGLKAYMTGMNVVGNNISNVNTNSFKSSSSTFRDVMYQDINGGSAGSDNAAGINPSQIGYGSAASSVDVDFTKGGMNTTGNANDVYIDGDGFFIVGDGAKTSVTADPVTGKKFDPAATVTDSFNGLKYTRIGTLKFDSNGYLTDGAGNYVCGYVNTTANMGTPAVYGKTLQAIRQPTTTSKDDPPVTTVDAIDNLAIAADGTITCNDGGTSKTLGRIELAKFTNNNGLQQIGNGYYKPTDNAGTITVTAPNGGGTGNLRTGALENSNVDLATEFSNMITFERAYQANTKIVSVADEMLQTLVNMK